jgi:hypothetical protein
MRIAAAFSALVLLAGALLGAAHAQRGVAPPRITVESVEPLPGSAGPQRFRIALVVDNMNTEPLRLRGIEFKLRLADEGIIDGATGPVAVDALDRLTVTLDVGSEIMSSLSRLLAFVQGPENTLTYEIYGTIYPERRFREPQRFSMSGHVPLVMAERR